jgi:chaperonin GroES
MYRRVVVKRKESLDQLASGLFIPEVSKEKMNEGTVVSVADDVLGDFIVGDTIVFGKYAGADITIDGEELLLVRAEEILGILYDE